MPKLRSVPSEADTITVGAVKAEFVRSGAAPVNLYVSAAASGFEWSGGLSLATAERLSSHLTLAIMEAREEAAGDE